MDKLYVVYSFDIGDEINLDAIKESLKNKYPLILRNKKSDIDYSRKPIEIHLRDVHISELNKKASIFLKLYDFGVISVFIMFEFESISLEFLKKIRYKVSESQYLLNIAKESIEEIRNYSTGLITKNMYDMSQFKFWEDYIIVEIHKDKNKFSDDLLLDIFYEAPQGKSLRNKIVSYYESKAIISFDLAVFIGNEDFYDCVSLGEFANVYLLELRYYDYILDKTIDEIESVIEEIKEKEHKFFGLNRKTVKKIDEINSLVFQISLEILRNIDKVENGLKFLGDIEINNLYKKFVQQLQLNVWKDSIETKLDYLHNLSEFLGQDIKEERMDRMESTMLVLEFLMLLLWIWEIVLLFIQGD